MLIAVALAVDSSPPAKTNSPRSMDSAVTAPIACINAGGTFVIGISGPFTMHMYFIAVLRSGVLSIVHLHVGRGRAKSTPVCEKKPRATEVHGLLGSASSRQRLEKRLQIRRARDSRPDCPRGAPRVEGGLHGDAALADRWGCPRRESAPNVGAGAVAGGAVR